MLLDVQPVAQAQRPELVFRQLAVEETPRLVAELGDPLGNERRVDFVVAVHGGNFTANGRPNAAGGRYFDLRARYMSAVQGRHSDRRSTRV